MQLRPVGRSLEGYTWKFLSKLYHSFLAKCQNSAIIMKSQVSYLKNLNCYPIFSVEQRKPRTAMHEAEDNWQTGTSRTPDNLRAVTMLVLNLRVCHSQPEHCLSCYVSIPALTPTMV